MWKTGGTSVADTLAHYADSHPKHIHSNHQELLDQGKITPDFWTFGIIRNPWALRASLFYHMKNPRPYQVDRNEMRPAGWEEKRLKRREEEEPAAHYRNEHVEQGMSAWLRWLLTKPKLEPQADWTQDMYGFFHTDEGRCVDQIYRLETLSENWGKLCRRLRIPYPPLKHINARGGWSRSAQYVKLYQEDPQAIELVAELHARDLEIWPYEYGK